MIGIRWNKKKYKDALSFFENKMELYRELN